MRPTPTHEVYDLLRAAFRQLPNPCHLPALIPATPDEPGPVVDLPEAAVALLETAALLHHQGLPEPLRELLAAAVSAWFTLGVATGQQPTTLTEYQTAVDAYRAAWLLAQAASLALTRHQAAGGADAKQSHA